MGPYNVSLTGFKQINGTFFAQIWTELLHLNKKFELIKSIYLLQVYAA